MVKLLTHNLLCCPAKACTGVSDAFPLEFTDAEVQEEKLECNNKLIINLIPRIDWEALLATAQKVGGQVLLI
jgi:multifunctional methyltransferase subunit TRM112